MNHSDFPIFTRRYAKEGLENFAFDILLGKPCLVVAHHSDFHDDSREIVTLIERLNHLNAQVVWTSLADVSGGVSASGNLLRVWLKSRCMPKKCGSTIFRRKKEPACAKAGVAPATIEEIRAGAQPVMWEARNNHVVFDVDVNPGESVTITIKFSEWDEERVYRREPVV